MITSSQESGFSCRILFAGLAALAIVGCSDGAGGTIDIDLASPVLFGTSDGIVQVVDIVSGADGRVWVLNSGPPYFLVFEASGALLTAFGERGGGPAEFRAPRRLVHVPVEGEYEVWVFDTVRHALIRIDAMLDSTDESAPAERALEEIPGRHVAEGPADRRPFVWSMVDGFGLVRQEGPMEFSLFDSALRNTEYLVLSGAAADSAARTRRVAATTTETEGAFPGPVPLWSTCSDGSVLRYDPDANAVLRWNSDGESDAPLELPAPSALPVTVDNVVNLVYEDMRMSLPSGEIPPREDIATMLDAQLRDETAVASRVMPEYVDLQCDGRGRVWIQPLSTTEGALGRGATWLRTSVTVTADQPGFSRVRFAAGFTPLNFEADRVWGVVRDDLDVSTLAWTALH